MKMSRVMVLAVLAAVPLAAGVLPLVTAQVPPGGQGQPGGAAPVPSIDPELPVELKKAQIQAELAGKIAQVKGDEAKALRDKGGDQVAIMEADLEALSSRLNADLGKINVESLDLQAKTPQYPPLPGYAPPPNPIAKQLMDLEVKKAQMSASAAEQVVNIRVAQFNAVDAAYKAGQADLGKRNDAYLNWESAKASAEIAKLDLGIVQSRAQQAGKR